MTPAASPQPTTRPAGELPDIVARGLRKDFRLRGRRSAASADEGVGPLAAVDGVDLAVASGEIFGLVGPDGAGKTTTMRHALRRPGPDRRRGEVAGFDVLRQPEEVKRRIGYMPQRFSLYGDLTVAENLLFFAEHLPRAAPSARKRERGAAGVQPPGSVPQAPGRSISPAA